MFVTIETGAALRARLDMLEARGRSYLAALGRRDALATATSAAARISVIMPLLGLFLAFVWPVPVAVLIAATIGVPLLSGVGAFALGRRIVVDRDTALALFDRGPGFKDRVAVSDEFLDRTDAGGFHAAAVAEAAPWITRALDVPLAHPEVRQVIRSTLRKRAGYPTGAAVVLVLAILLGRPVGSDSQSPVEMRGEAASNRGQAGGDPGAVRSDLRGATVATAIAAMFGDRLGLVDALHGRADGGGDMPPSGDAASGAERPRPGAAAGDATGAANAGAAASAGGGQGAAGRGGGAGGAGEGAAGRDGGGSAPGGEQASISERTESTAGMARQRNGESGTETPAPAPGEVRTDAASRRAERPRPPGAEPGQASPNAPGSANPADTRRSTSPPQADQGDGQRPAPGRPGERSEGQEQSQGNKPGQGSNSPGTAQESLKRSRGLSSLLLAVPTVDRLAGTPDAGPSRSTLRRVSPEAREAGAALAGDRGVQGGDAGIVAQRPATPHEARLVRDYFNRGGGERR
ncbi:hypothetical protein [Sphingomonas sp. Leaf67]|uniref:hypothetical protein n=1 Tax=Sphingomonas sp. Leaf67 TaxID=1736230 RepID=UPI000ACDD8B5|nr:hypothetical protein [Sphingomonas sp. Leaf67]